MFKTAFAVALFIAALLPISSPGAVDRLQKEDAERFVVGILNLYYNIGKGFVEYCKTCVLSLDDLPKAVATDIFQVGQKKEPVAYYMTEKEKKEREEQKRLEQRLREEEKKALQTGPGQPPITSIRP